MAVDLLLATTDHDVEREVRDVLAENSRFEVTAVAASVAELEQRVADGAHDAVLLHEDLGPAPAMVVLRELVHHQPAAAVALLSRERGPDAVAEAMRAGARAVLPLPLSWTQVEDRLDAVVGWSRRIRAWQLGDAEDSSRRRGRVVALTGARGGAGATILSIHLALAAQRAGARTCLLDLDLQTGDVGALMGVPGHHSAVDLVDVDDELTGLTAEESMFVHASGLHVLPAPAEGERAELVTAAGARRLVAVLRGAWDVVVVDCGSTVTEAALGAVDSADRTLVVTQPDVSSLQATHRLVDLWTRVQGRRPDGLAAVLNRRSRRRAVQPGLVRRALDLPVCRTTVPSRFEALEHALNTQRIDEVDDRRFARAVRDLTRETCLDPEPSRARSALSLPVRRRRPDAVADSGAQHAEVAVLLPVLLLLALLVAQGVLYGAGLLVAQRRAAEVADELAAGTEPAAAVDRVGSDLPPGWDLVGVDTDDAAVVVRVRPPTLVPGVDPDVTLRGSAVR